MNNRCFNIFNHLKNQSRRDFLQGAFTLRDKNYLHMQVEIFDWYKPRRLICKWLEGK